MNLVEAGDVALTLVLLLLVVAGFAFELMGETVQGWHTISWWAHRNKWLRYSILAAGVLLIIFLATHFAGNSISR